MCVCVKEASDASSITALTSPSKRTGKTITVRSGIAQSGANVDVIRRHVGEQDLVFLLSALTDQPFTDAEQTRDFVHVIRRIAGQHSQAGLAVDLGFLIDDAILGIDQGRQLGQ